MSEIPRVALFADTFHELNGAANFLRRLVSFAKENEYPMLCVRSGEATEIADDGSVRFLNLKRSRASIPLENNLRYDPLVWTNRAQIKKTLREFNPQVLHLTGLNDISQI